MLVELHEEKHSDFPFLTQAKTTLNNTRNLYPVCANKQHLKTFSHPCLCDSVGVTRLLMHTCLQCFQGCYTELSSTHWESPCWFDLV